jgi:Ctr copper transporter family
MNMNMNDGSGGDSGVAVAPASPMNMVFTDWVTYQMTLLFGEYIITTPWQFALTWFAVVLAAFLYQSFMCAERLFDQLVAARVMDARNEKEDWKLPQSSYGLPHGWTWLRVAYGFLVGTRYAFGLILMMIAMTMNPNLLLALGVGYAVGGMIFYNYMIDIQLPDHLTRFMQRFTTKRLLYWMKTHSVTDHFVLFGSILVYPVAVFATFALIERTCRRVDLVEFNDDYTKMNAKFTSLLGSDLTGFFALGFPSDMCNMEGSDFERKALRVSFAVYYIFLFFAGVFMFVAARHEKFFRFLHDEVVKGTYITNGEIIVFSMVATLLVFNCWFWYDRFYFQFFFGGADSMMAGAPRSPYYFATMVTGRLCDVSLGLVMLPTSKNSLLQLCMGISYNSSLR